MFDEDSIATCHRVHRQNNWLKQTCCLNVSRDLLDIMWIRLRLVPE